jgi:hypothetical protein
VETIHKSSHQPLSQRHEHPCLGQWARAQVVGCMLVLLQLPVKPVKELGKIGFLEIDVISVNYNYWKINNFLEKTDEKMSYL